jgi:hypothetical protein
VTSARLLVLLLRLGGAVLSLAFLAVVMPADWMVATHAWLGLGELPRLPIVDYLTRSVAALYGIRGVLMLLAARDLVRFKPIIRYLGITDIVFGMVVTGIDVSSGLPMWWTLGEGPPVVVYGGALLYLASRVRDYGGSTKQDPPYAASRS